MGASSPLFQGFLSILSGIVVALLSGYVSQIRDNQRWLKEEVYRPLYRELNAAAKGKLPKEKETFRSEWKDFDAYQRLRVDEDLRGDLDEYSEKLQLLNSKKPKLTANSELGEKLPAEIVQGDGELRLVGMRAEKRGAGGHIALMDWIDMFREIVIHADDPEQMREQLIQYSEENNLGHERNFRGWDEHVPGWHEQFYEAFNDEIEGETESYYALKEDEIPDIAEDIRAELEGRIDEGLLGSIYRRVF